MRPSPIDDLAPRLAARLPELARHFRGEPNRGASDRSRLAWGSRGSFVVGLTGRHAGRWHNFEGGEHGDALDLIRLELGLDTRGAIAWAREFLGDPARLPPGPARPAPAPADEDEPERIRKALRLWDSAVSPTGTLVEAYLAGRRLELDPAVARGVLRFHPGVPWRDDAGEVVRVPAMVGLMRDALTDEPRAVHVTALTPDGRKIGKRMRGAAGGAVVKLDPDEAVTMGLGVAEGIETALAVRKIGWRPVWAATSAGAIANLPVLPGLESLTLFADHDEAGLKAARTCARRWAEAGREAAVRMPRRPGADWNDEVLA
ncbi:DUF7146 domain-containing protein [Alsobacter sp. R-9]